MQAMKRRPLLAFVLLLLTVVWMSIPVLGQIPPLDSSSSSSGSSSESSTSSGSSATVFNTDGMDTDPSRSSVSESEAPTVINEVVSDASDAGEGDSSDVPSSVPDHSAPVYNTTDAVSGGLPVSGGAATPKIAMAITGAALLAAGAFCGKNRRKD